MENFTKPEQEVVAPAPAPQYPEIDMEHIKMIESSGDPMAFNKHSKARGLYQITPITLEEWNMRNKKKQYSRDDLFNPKVNEEIATWYMKKRIPQMLTYFKQPVTLENMLASYNWGIDYVVKKLPMPEETREYIRKYKDKIGVKNDSNPSMPQV